MRRVAQLAGGLILLLAACAAPRGVEPPGCDEDAEDAPPVIVEAGSTTAASEPVQIDCWRPDGRRRVLLGFTLPPGPDCYRLSGVELIESADAVSVTVSIARVQRPASGACAIEPSLVRTEVDLQSPLADRVLLDASRDPS